MSDAAPSRSEPVAPTAAATDYSRSRAAAPRARPRAGRGLPGIEPGMPLPAGTGLTRRSFISRRAGWRCRLRRRERSAREAFEEGIAAAAAAGPSDPVLVSVFLVGRRRLASACSPRRADPQLRHAAARRSRCAADPGTPFTEDTSLRWHPAAARWRRSTGRARSRVIPAIGYTDPNQSHFTSRHYWEVGETEPGRAPRLAGPLPRPARRRRTTRSRGSRSAGIARAGARDRRRTRSPPSPSPTTTSFWRVRRRGAGRDADARRVRRRSAGSPTGDPRLAQARGAVAATARLRDAARAVPAATQPHGRATRRGLRPAPGRARRDARRRPAAAGASRSRPPAATTPTPTRSARLAAEHRPRIADSLLAFQRDLEARGLADRVLVHVWSEFGRRAAGERLGHRPRRGRRLVPDRHAGAGRDGRRVPGPRDRLRRARQPGQPARDLRLPRRLQRRCWSSGSASTPRRSSRAPTASPATRS